MKGCGTSCRNARKVLDDLAHLLSEKEMVQGEELRKMLSEYGLGKAAKGA